MEVIRCSMARDQVIVGISHSPTRTPICIDSDDRFLWKKWKRELFFAAKRGWVDRTVEIRLWSWMSTGKQNYPGKKSQEIRLA